METCLLNVGSNQASGNRPCFVANEPVVTVPIPEVALESELLVTGCNRRPAVAFWGAWKLG